MHPVGHGPFPIRGNVGHAPSCVQIKVQLIRPRQQIELIGQEYVQTCSNFRLCFRSNMRQRDAPSAPPLDPPPNPVTVAMAALWKRARTTSSPVRVWGWTRFVNKTKTRFLSQSIQSVVPVNPVWPKLPGDRSSPQDLGPLGDRLADLTAASVGSNSQPRPRDVSRPGV